MANTILVIDDELDILTLAIARLETSGYNVLKAETAEEGLAILKKKRPDLILLDILLPGMQGDELCRMLKKDSRLKSIPVILFTASIVRVPAKIKEIGADDYIIKPFEPDMLIYKIKRLIDHIPGIVR